MASSLSFSQSITSSIIIHKYLHDRNHKQSTHDNVIWSERSKPSGAAVERKDISVWKQVLLTVAIFGYSCCIEFEALFSVVSMQYFGVPVYFVSISGLTSGILATLVVPVLGRLSDRGPEPLKRKLFAMMVSTVCLLAGYTILFAYSWMKLTQMATTNTTTHYQGYTNATTIDINITVDDSNHLYNSLPETLLPSLVTTFNSSNYNEVGNDDGGSTINHLAENYSNHLYNISPSTLLSSNFTISKSKTVNRNEVGDESNGSIPLLAILSILPFTLFDSGYDTSMSMSRASVLELVPAHQTKSILTMAGLMNSLSGMTASILGIVDFPTILAPAFGVDGFAATLMLLSVFFGLLGLGSLTCSIKTIYKMYKEKLTEESSRKEYTNEFPEKQTILSHQNSYMERFQNSTTTKYLTNSSSRQSVSRYPLISSMSSQSIEDSSNVRLNLNTTDRQTNPSFGYCTFVSSVDPSTAVSENNLKSGKSDINISVSESLRQNYDQESLLDNYKLQHSNHNLKVKATSLLLSISKSYEMYLGRQNLQNFNGKERNQPRKQKSSPSVFNTRFCVCLVMSFFAFAAVTMITIYQSNTLTLQLFKGEPLAMPGSPGRIRYEQGIRMSAFGTLSAYISYMLVLIASIKINDRFGPLRQMIAINAMYAMTAGLYFVYPRLETYFLMMVMYGVLKFGVLTTSFVIATLYAGADTQTVDNAAAETETSSTNNRSPRSSSNPTSASASSNAMGQTMACVSMTVPIGYVFISAVMGPLMDAVGNFWPPIYLSGGSAVLAMLTGIILSFM